MRCESHAFHALQVASGNTTETRVCFQDLLLRNGRGPGSGGGGAIQVFSHVSRKVVILMERCIVRDSSALDGGTRTPVHACTHVLMSVCMRAHAHVHTHHSRRN